MITQRRVFQAKPGMSGGVVTKMKEFQPIFERHGGLPCRYYTDQLSGRTDRVVWEFDTESLSSLDNILWAASQNADFVRDYESWYAGLTPLLDSAIVELWNLE